MTITDSPGGFNILLFTAWAGIYGLGRVTIIGNMNTINALRKAPETGAQSLERERVYKLRAQLVYSDNYSEFRHK